MAQSRKSRLHIREREREREEIAVESDTVEAGINEHSDTAIKTGPEVRVLECKR